MKKYALVLSVFITSVSASPSLAGKVEIDFDGTHNANCVQSVKGQKTLTLSLASEFPVDSMPIPEVPVTPLPLPNRWDINPFCVAWCDGGNSGNPPAVSPTFLGKTFPAMVCLKKAGLAQGDCMTKTGREAAFSLSLDMTSDIYTDNAKEILTFRFGPITNVEFAEVLYQMTMHAIDMVVLQLTESIKKLQPLEWDSPEEKARKMRIVLEFESAVKEWNRAARLEAARGLNWKRVQGHEFQFNDGPAYTQLDNAFTGSPLRKTKILFRNLFPGFDLIQSEKLTK